jgi:hypothetical protein
MTKLSFGNSKDNGPRETQKSGRAVRGNELAGRISESK